MVRGTVSLALATLPLAALLPGGCGYRERERAPADQIEGAASPEPIEVLRGQRTIEVRCERSCGPTQVELSRLQRGCVRDPMSQVHHLTEREALIHLGCCTEAASVLAEACGDEGSMGACLERWSLHCEAGELLELDEPRGDRGPT